MSVRLPADVYSPDHIGVVLWELGHLIDHRRNAATRAKVVSNAAAEEPHLSALLGGVLRSSEIAADDLQALEQLQTGLRLVRDKAPVAHILLSASPTRVVKREIVGWFRTQLHAQCLVTFAMRSDIGGGFVLRIGSKQYDFSYRQRLLEDKHRLTEIFDGVRQ